MSNTISPATSWRCCVQCYQSSRQLEILRLVLSVQQPVGDTVSSAQSSWRCCAQCYQSSDQLEILCPVLSVQLEMLCPVLQCYQSSKTERTVSMHESWLWSLTAGGRLILNCCLTMSVQTQKGSKECLFIMTQTHNNNNASSHSVSDFFSMSLFHLHGVRWWNPLSDHVFVCTCIYKNSARIGLQHTAACIFWWQLFLLVLEFTRAKHKKVQTHTYFNMATQHAHFQENPLLMF